MTSIFQGLVEKAQGLVHFDVGVGDVASSFATLPGVSGDYFSTPDSLDNSIRQAIIIEADIAADNYSAFQAIVTKSVDGQDPSYRLMLSASAQIVLTLYDTADTNDNATSISLVGTVNNGERIKIRALYDPTLLADNTTFEVDTGNGWEFFSIGNNSMREIRDSANPVEVGSLNNGTGAVFAGKIYSTRIYKGVTPEPYAVLDGVAGSYLSTPDTVDNSIRGSITFEADLALTDWTPAVVNEVITKYGGAGSRSWLFRVGSGIPGQIVINIFQDGTNGLAAVSSEVVNFVDGSRHTIRAEWNAVAQEVTFFADGVQLGNVINLLASTIFDADKTVEIGSINNGASNLLNGIVYDAKVYKGIPNNPVDAYVALDGVLSLNESYVDTPSTPENSITGSMTIEFDGALDDWSNLIQVLVAKYVSTGGQRSWRLEVSAGGAIVWLTSVDGGATLVGTQSTIASGFANGTRHTVKIIYDAVAQTVTFYTDGAQLGTVLPHVTAGIFDSTAPVSIGARDAGANSELLGFVYGAKISDGINGPIVLDMDPYPYIQGDPTFVGGQGNVFTLQGAAVAVSPIDDGLKVHMDPQPALQGMDTFGGEATGPEEWTDPPDAVGADWVDNGDGSYTVTAAVGANNIRMNIGAVLGILYEVNFTVDSISTPEGVFANIGGDVGATATAIGTYKQFVLDTLGNHPQLRIVSEIGATATVSNISFKRATGEVWTVHGNAIATSPIDDGLKSSFVPDALPNSDVEGEVWTSNGDVTTLVSAMMRNLYWNPLSDFEAAVYASVGEVAVAFGAGGLSFDAGSRLRIAYGGGADKINLPGGMAATPDGSLIVGGPPDVIHQGVGLTNECYVSDAQLAGLLSESIAWFDETSIVGDVTDWNNKGAGGSPFNLDTVVGTAGNLTRMANGWARLPGEVGDAFQTPNVALNEITGDLDVRWFGRADVWNINQTLFSHASTPAGQSWELQGRNTHTIRLTLSQDGTVTDLIDSPTLPFPIGGGIGGVRATVNFATQLVQFYTSTDGITWTELGAPVATILTSLFATTTPVVVGARNAGNSLPMTGYCIYAQAYSGIYNGGPLNTPGPELVINGTFDQPVGAEWVPTANATIAVVGGQAEVTNTDGGGGSQATQTIGLIKGRRYRLTAQGRKGTATNATLRVTGGGNDYTDVTTDPNLTEFTPLEFTSTGVSLFIALRTVDIGTAYFDNVSLVEISPQLAIRFDPSDATLPQTVWNDPVLGNAWTPKGDAFVNTTGKDVVNSAGAVAIETALQQLIDPVPYTVFMSAKVTGLTGLTGFFTGARSDNTKQMALILSDLGQYRVDAGVTQNIGGADTLPHIWTAQQNGDVTSVFTVSGETPVVGDMGAEVWDFGTLFNNSASGFPVVGWIGEVVIFDRALTAEELSIMQDYLANKWT